MSEAVDPKIQEQVRHLAGLAALMDWRQRWSNVRHALRQEGDVLTLGFEPTARFALALPKSPRQGRFPVLLIQPDEAEWLGLLAWERVHVQEDRLSLVSRRQVSAGGDLPDLPAFALTLSLGGEVAELPFHRFSHLDVRGYWTADGVHWQVDNGPPLRTLPISPPGAPLLTAQDRQIGESFQDKVRKHSARLSTVQPAFRGQRPDLSAWSDDFLLKTSPLPSEPRE